MRELDHGVRLEYVNREREAMLWRRGKADKQSQISDRRAAGFSLSGRSRKRGKVEAPQGHKGNLKSQIADFR